MQVVSLDAAKMLAFSETDWAQEKLTPDLVEKLHGMVMGSICSRSDSGFSVSLDDFACMAHRYSLYVSSTHERTQDDVELDKRQAKHEDEFSKSLSPSHFSVAVVGFLRWVFGRILLGSKGWAT